MSAKRAAQAIAFTATAIAVVEDRELNYRGVVLAEREDSDGPRLEITRSIETDAQDARLEMDTYCLCTNSGATHYGGVKEWSFSPKGLRLELSAKAADALELPMQVEIRFAQEEMDLVAVRRMLTTVFADALPKP